MTDPQGYKLRDLREKGHFTIDNDMVDEGWIAKIGTPAYATYGVICRHANPDTATAFPSYDRIAEKTGLSKRKVILNIQRLEAFMMISIPVRVKGRGKINEIYLLDKSLWDEPSHYQKKKPRSDKGKPRLKGEYHSPLLKGDYESPFNSESPTESGNNGKGEYHSPLFEKPEKVNNKSEKGEYHSPSFTLYKETNKKGTNKRGPQPAPAKIAYAEFVHLTQEEHTKLCEKLSTAGVTDYIDRLNFYKGSKGITYKSDYFTILNWWHKDQKQQPKRGYVSKYDESMELLRQAAQECQS